jgi:hypothetical protein
MTQASAEINFSSTSFIVTAVIATPCPCPRVQSSFAALSISASVSGASPSLLFSLGGSLSIWRFRRLARIGERRVVISDCRRNTTDSLNNNKSEGRLYDKVIVVRANTSKRKVIRLQSQVQPAQAINQFGSGTG